MKPIGVDCTSARVATAPSRPNSSGLVQLLTIVPALPGIYQLGGAKLSKKSIFN
jgi:hypothetical protein